MTLKRRLAMGMAAAVVWSAAGLRADLAASRMAPA